jgi:hypothetical protein
MKFATGMERSHIISVTGSEKERNSGERVCGPCRLGALTSRRFRGSTSGVKSHLIDQFDRVRASIS